MAVLAVLPLAAGRAQSAAPNDAQPLQIQADSGIEWQQNAHLYIARGNAVAIRGPSELHADTLIAHYREVKGGNADQHYRRQHRNLSGRGGGPRPVEAQ